MYSENQVREAREISLNAIRHAIDKAGVAVIIPEVPALEYFVYSRNEDGEYVEKVYNQSKVTMFKLKSEQLIQKYVLDIRTDDGPLILGDGGRVLFDPNAIGEHIDNSTYMISSRNLSKEFEIYNTKPGIVTDNISTFIGGAYGEETGMVWGLFCNDTDTHREQAQAFSGSIAQALDNPAHIHFIETSGRLSGLYPEGPPGNCLEFDVTKFIEMADDDVSDLEEGSDILRLATALRIAEGEYEMLAAFRARVLNGRKGGMDAKEPQDQGLKKLSVALGKSAKKISAVTKDLRASMKAEELDVAKNANPTGPTLDTDTDGEQEVEREHKQTNQRGSRTRGH